jgi:hypothetical protein
MEMKTNKRVMILHERLAHVNFGLRYIQDITYKDSLDSIRIIDKFYISKTNRQKEKQFMQEF